ncbi:MAG: tRNA 2-selenouridine(34) synthase MnmH [Myxococcales bacterium]|nr:tRNA 2-selenouridine(34) synthase MnmH [Myxococcales bacterium]
MASLDPCAAPDFLAAHGPILDVRTPAEFAAGHIPGAHNLPLFSNAERAEVGTIYKKQSRAAAIELGLALVGPKLASLVAQAKAIAGGGDATAARVHCWRGGMRSASMAWLLRLAGLQTTVLAGGYKAYRAHMRAQWEASERPMRLMVLGGKTGAGKTKVLAAMAALGEAVIDLEGLARHRGSAFGGFADKPQPTVEQFENELGMALRNHAGARRIWVENESRRIDCATLPDPFWAQMAAAPLIVLDVPYEDRLAATQLDYADVAPAELVRCFAAIEKRLGGLVTGRACAAVRAGDLVIAADIALRYYDASYDHSAATRQQRIIATVAARGSDPAREIAARVLRAVDERA